MIRRDLADRRARVDRALAEHPHLEFDRQVAVEQAADTDHDDREVSGDVAPLGHRATLRGDQRRAVVFTHDVLVAGPGDDRGERRRDGRARAGRRVLGLVVERTQAAFANLVLPALRIGEHLRRVADHAQRDRHDEEDQDQHEPPRAVHVVQAERAENVRPERPELVHIVRIRIVLGQDRADDARNRQHHQQRDREAHRAQQLDRALGRTLTRLRLQPRRGNAHSNSDSGETAPNAHFVRLGSAAPHLRQAAPSWLGLARADKKEGRGNRNDAAPHPFLVLTPAALRAPGHSRG